MESFWMACLEGNLLFKLLFLSQPNNWPINARGRLILSTHTYVLGMIDSLIGALNDFGEDWGEFVGIVFEAQVG